MAVAQGIDHSKRKQVMQRSTALGHCICDVKRGCPCEVFVKQNLCPCAGERPAPVDISQIKLTALSANTGCASKISAGDLEGLLARLPVVADPDVISGLAAADDAGVYRINENTTLVQTVDVFTPCVDDPYTFGRICAANCLSDIYAMGALPRTALSILCFPSETHDKEIMFLMLKGAMDVLAEANCALLGGHSIKDTEVKLGFAVTGTIKAGMAVSLETARPGDVLVLTKPLGVGVLTFAHQIHRVDPKDLQAAERSMMMLNKEASAVMVDVGVSACTDITGFGLFGHLLRMMRHSGTSARIYAPALPAFEGALDLLRRGVISGAMERNSEFASQDMAAEASVAEEYKYLGFSPETSGGLMIAVPLVRLGALMDGLKARGVDAVVIGEVRERQDKAIELVMTQREDTMSIQKNERGHSEKAACCCSETSMAAATANEGLSTTAGASMKAFGDLIATVTASGKIDKRTKELILFAAVLMQRCHGCFDLHYEKALGMGITKEELDEVMWCAALVGGAPVKMFYGECLKLRGGK
ncbi:MAG: selenide, water dikinase SelD [Candidatus Omnitrophica bacterium]|nr:selenide, water dikinase SelD [Candidatus Omnitrophota bacterium]